VQRRRSPGAHRDVPDPGRAEMYPTDSRRPVGDKLASAARNRPPPTPSYTTSRRPPNSASSTARASCTRAARASSGLWCQGAAGRAACVGDRLRAGLCARHHGRSAHADGACSRRRQRARARPTRPAAGERGGAPRCGSRSRGARRGRAGAPPWPRRRRWRPRGSRPAAPAARQSGPCRPRPRSRARSRPRAAARPSPAARGRGRP